MLDIHCHLLPGIDDGPPTLEAALALAQELVRDGVSHVVCTPHVFPGRFENRAASIEDEFLRFEQQVADAGIPLALSWAGEVRLTPEVLEELLPRRQLPYLGEHDGMRNMLLEMPDGQVPLGADRFMRRLMASGIRPVIVHPERNRGVMERIERLEAFVEDGCFVQVTAGSLVGQFGVKAQQVAHALVDAGWVNAVASDAHNLGGRRPRMKDAHKYLVTHWGERAANELTLLTPAEICGVDLGASASLGQTGRAERHG